MADIDEFASTLLEESKRFLEMASEVSDEDAKTALLHASLLLACSALEAHVNAVADDFLSRSELSEHERGILLEREVQLKDGEFVLSGLKMYRLEDRLGFLYKKFATSKLNKKDTWWGQLKSAIDLRNKLVHPKETQTVTREAVETAVDAIIKTIDALYRAIYKKPFPATNMGLQSRFTF